MSFAVTAVVVTVGATAYSVAEQQDAGRRAKNLANTQATQEREAAAAEAEKIQERAVRLKASQTAALAGSGVKLSGDGSSAALLNETDRLAEQDALAVLRGGANRADYLSAQGAAAARSANAGAIATGLNGISSSINSAAAINRAGAPGRAADSMNKQTDLTYKNPNAKRYSLLGDT